MGNSHEKNSFKRKKSFKEIFIKAVASHSAGNIKEAIKEYNYLLNNGFNDPRVFANYGNILKNLGKLKDAELAYRTAIELKPDFFEVYFFLGALSKDLGRLKDAELFYQQGIKLKPDLAEGHSNYANILRDLDKLKEAELSYRTAIKLKPNSPHLHYNFGRTLIDLGKLKDAELAYRTAIELKPDFAKAYFSLSKLNYSKENLKWERHLFSKEIFKQLTRLDKVDIYFARANIFHKKKYYTRSAQNLDLANNLKLEIYSSNADSLIKKSKNLLIESKKKKLKQKENGKYPESIFIVGMPRSGSTLVESILSINSKVTDLGEVNILEKAFLMKKNKTQRKPISEIYFEEIKNIKGKVKITTNKWLYNYQYSGIIINEIPNSKIIHCFRNPLDNILSLIRANFSQGISYSSSIKDCTKVYLDQELIMQEYKKRFRSNIYDLNYDLLVTNPKQFITDLIAWLNWEWEDYYLYPHLNKRSVLTASNVEIRSPINSKSLGGWQNYKDMLIPAIEILKKHEKFNNTFLY